jgi:adenylosuccinate synthase
LILKGHTLIVADALWGDSGKGKIAAHVAYKEDYDISVRAGTGTNAGHSIHVGDKYIHTNQLPLAGMIPNKSGKKMILTVGSGVCVDPEKMNKEINDNEVFGRAIADWRCPVITQDHKDREAGGKQYSEKHTGSTKSGTGEARVDYIKRIAPRLSEDAAGMFTADVAKMINEAYDEGKKIVIEGSQGHYLSLYLSPEYPVVTSDNCTVSAFIDDVGLAWNKVDDVCMVVKSAPTRVSQACGDLPGEISTEEIENLGVKEYGVTTGRLRRKSLEIPFDLLEDVVMINQPTYFALTFCDHVDDFEGVELDEYVKLEDLKRFTKTYNNAMELERRFGIPVKYIEYGKDFSQIAEVI